MLVVGIAGPAGSGKSTVCRLLSRRPGFAHLDCDELARKAYEPGGPAYARVVEAFGPGILRGDGTVDRRKLGALVFSDPARRRKLEAAVHPAVAEGIRRAAERFRKEGKRVLLVEGALLFHSPYVPRDLFHLAIWLEASEGVRRERLRAAGLPHDEIERRFKAQSDLRPPPWAEVVNAEPPPDVVAKGIVELIEKKGAA